MKLFIGMGMKATLNYFKLFKATLFDQIKSDILVNVLTKIVDSMCIDILHVANIHRGPGNPGLFDYAN